MPTFRRVLQDLGALLIAAGFLSGCGGAHGAGQSTLPVIPNAKHHAAAVAAASIGDIAAINAGGSAAGGFAADGDFVGSGTWTYATTKTIDTSGVTNPAPQAVYQTEREGPAITYTLPGLTAGTAYTVKLSFAELWWTAAGQRVFNVSINNVKVLTNFDVFAAAGAAGKAVNESFTATASGAGTITIALSAVTNYAAISAIEIVAASPTPAPSATPAGSVSIDAGGAASGNFAADQDFSANTWTYKVANTVDVSGVTSPAPQTIYQTEREGPTIAYTLPGLTPGASYVVRLDFAELWWTAAGQRVFNVSINNVAVLTNFDVFAAAAARFKAVSQSFTATASPTGTIAITLTKVIDNAAINGIEIAPSGGSPAPTPTPAFNDYRTFGYDNARDVFNPNTTPFTPATLTNIHLAWQATLGGGDYNTQTQPILATEIAGHAGVLFVGGGSGNVYGYDALTGSLLWTRNTGQETYTCEGGNTAYFGVGGSAAYDPASKSLYIVGNNNAAANAPAANSLYHLDGASGTILGQVNFAPSTSGWPGLDFSHTSVTLGNNGLAYVGTGATCDISSWRGRVAAISVPSMSVANTFFTVWDPQNSRGGGAQPWGGGGVWGWGGVALDTSGNVLTGVGNTDNGVTTHGSIVAPFMKSPAEDSGLGDAFIEVSPDLSTLENASHPIAESTFSGDSLDLDLQGTPVLFAPNGTGCDPMAALQAKSGTLYLYDRAIAGNAGLVGQYQLAPSSYSDGFLGGPAYSSATGLLYVAVTSSNESLFPPGMIAINPGCGAPSVAWHAAFGPDSYAPGSDVSPGTPRSVPAVSAGGVVFVGTNCTPAGAACSATTSSSARRPGQSAVRKPLICCAPPGTGGGALWALDASTGTVLNGGNPLIVTSGPLRMPPTIDGDWLFVLDNAGNLYALTLDTNYAAISSKQRAPSSRMLRAWQTAPTGAR